MYSLSDAQTYIYHMAEDVLDDQPVQEEKRRRLMDDKNGNSCREITRCNTEQLTEMITKVMQILQQHPQLLQDQGEQLAKIRNQVKVIAPAYSTAKFELFSKLVDHSLIDISAHNDDSYRVNSALLVLHSEVIRNKFNFDGKDDLSHLELSQFSSEEIHHAVQILEQSNTENIVINDAASLLALADCLDIPLLIKILEQRFSTIEHLTEEDIVQIVSTLNEECIDHYPHFKMKLEHLISNFFLDAFEYSTPEDYLTIKRVIKELRRPISLDFSNGKLRNIDLAQIKKIPLKSINLTKCCNLSSSCILFLKEMEGLEEIKADNNPWVDNLFLEKTSQILSLKKLSLNDCRSITDEGIKHLPNQLNCLHLARCPGLTDESDAKFSQMIALQELNLDTTSVGDATVSALSNGIKKLKLNSWKITDKSAAKFGQMIALQELDLSYTSVGDDTVNALSNGIKKLKLNSSLITDRSAAKFSQMANLKELDLSSTSVGDETVRALINGIEKLKLYGCKEITDRSAAKFGQMTALKILDLSSTSTGDATVMALSNGMEKLWLNECKLITDRSAEKFSQMTNLKELDLSYTSVGDEIVRAISNGIEKLMLCSCKEITDRSAAKFGQMTALKILDLSSTSTGDATVMALSNGVEKLWLNNCPEITDGLAVKFGQMTALRKLDLSNTSIGDATVIALSNGLKKLMLNGCQNVTHLSAEKFSQMSALPSADVRSLMLQIHRQYYSEGNRARMLAGFRQAEGR